MGALQPVFVTSLLNTLIDRIYDAIGTTPLCEHVAERVARVLQPFLGAPGLLTPPQCQPGRAEPRQHVLYVAPDKRFSVATLVMLPGQETPIHDHPAWCVSGVHQGEEHEIHYRLLNVDGAAWLVPLAGGRRSVGATTDVVPPDDIHQVANRGPRPAISIQICGANLQHESNTRRLYDLPILASMEELAALPPDHDS